MVAVLYAETSRMRTLQVVGDLAVVGWIVLWLVLGAHLYDLVAVLAAPGEQLAGVGTELAAGADGVADVVGDAPLVGGGIAAPFSALGDAARGLADVGESTRDAARRLALWTSVLVALAAIVVVARPYLWWRWVWVRRASEAVRLRDHPGAIRLLALRAAVRRPVAELVGVSPDPLRDVDERPELLAGLELRHLGLRSAGPSGERASG